MKKFNVDKVLVVKALGMVMTIGGMIAANWSGKKEQDQTLEKIVTEKLSANKQGIPHGVLFFFRKEN